ncbi:unnamed protein product [Caenorhabditis bovis]|uniref:Peptidase A1 domain-containing protein n=1 Tax=Caenorhabditis bovis TaxID=2654633 RepID=A0A8S1EAZ3_9PELO|nr:unnamed protein product [Caenorhabditis bovis]
MTKLAILLLAILVVDTFAAVHQLNLGYRPPLRQRLAAEGKLEQYVREQKIAGAKSQQLNSVSSGIIDYEDMAYMVQISLGTPAQNFVLFIDSGSSNLWVPDVSCAGGKDATCGSYCKSTPYDACLTFCQEQCCTKSAESPRILAAKDACQSKHHFNSSLSSTYVANGQPFDITYNTGEVKGFFGQDKFCFINSTLCTDKQIFAQATTIGEAFGKQPEDGILGLGWPSLAVNQQTPPIFNLLNDGKLDQPYFVVYLARIGPTSQLNGGALTVGGLDSVNCNANVDWVPLSTKTFWQFKLGGVSSGSYKQAPAAGWQAAADTAASFIGAPKTVVQQLAKSVGATYVPLTGAYFIDCDAVVPDIVFTINGKDYSMPSTSFVVSAGPGPCMFAFYHLTAGGFYPAWMLGPPFMRAYCHVHDVQNGRLGLAKVN